MRIFMTIDPFPFVLFFFHRASLVNMEIGYVGQPKGRETKLVLEWRKIIDCHMVLIWLSPRHEHTQHVMP